MQDIWPQLEMWVDKGERFAMATVVSASKPSPRGVGACLAIHEDGIRFIGSVSAGCVESEVIEAAKLCLADGEARWLSFGPGQGFPWEIELSCGGEIEVRVEPAPHLVEGCSAVSSVMYDCLRGHSLGMLVSDGTTHGFFDEHGETLPSGTNLSPKAITLARRKIATGGSTEELEVDGRRVLFRVLGKRPRLFVIGASHIAIHLVQLAKMLQYEVVTIDPRDAYAQEERFFVKPDRLISEWPSLALDGYGVCERDCLVTITHDPKIDDEALETALRSTCGYIGALGSRKSHAARLRRLEKAGFTAESLARIHGPVGLDIGSRTPAEIAVSVVAQLVQWRNGGRA